MTTLVLGAGIAGIVAARDLVDAGQDVMILEARGRIGGRIFTRRDIVDGIPIEMGAEFFHGERAPQWEIARKLDAKMLHWTKQNDSMVRMEDDTFVTMREARLNPLFDVTRSWELPDVPVHPEDEDLYHYLSRIGFTKDQLQYTRRSFVNATGDSIHHISAAAALQDMHESTAGEQDWRILDGYDTIVQHLAIGLDIRLKTVVTTIDWSGDRVKVTALNGKIFEGEQVVIALPTGVLYSNMIEFDPPLPETKTAALSDLDMGPGMKMVFVFEKNILPNGIMALYSKHNPPMWWSPTYGHKEAKRFAITAFVTGDWARQLYRLGEDGMILKSLQTLRAELGKGIPDPLAVHIQDWTDDPFTGGVYSVVSPGGLHCRADLARPLHDKLYWAGEATALNGWGATVHGAYNSGRRAAKEILSRAN